VVAAVLGIAVWGAVAKLRGLPISISHGLVAGLAGAGIVTEGRQVLLWSGWQKVIIGLGFSTLVTHPISRQYNTEQYARRRHHQQLKWKTL